MPEQPRIERILYLKKGADKNRDAQKPGNTANERGKPGQMNEAPARFRQRKRIHRRARPKAAIQCAKGKNSLQPHKDADRVNDAVVNHDRLKKAALKSGELSNGSMIAALYQMLNALPRICGITGASAVSKRP